MFKTNNIRLSTLLKRINDGEIQLPDFQRDWVWSDEHIKRLLESVIKRFPIGAILTLENGGETQFSYRLVQGASANETKEPDEYLLDGQQRLTSLLQTLASREAVHANVDRARRLRWYFIDLIKAAYGEDDIVVSVPETLMMTKEGPAGNRVSLATANDQYEHHMIPTYHLLDPLDWQDEYREYWRKIDPQPDTINRRLKAFNQEVVDSVKGYEIPVISLEKHLPRRAVCGIFERVNTGGVHLSVFELLTAILAADRIDLRGDWDERETRFSDDPVLRGLSRDRFLQVVALITTNGEGCDKDNILDIGSGQYLEAAELATRGFRSAARFVRGLGIYRSGDIPFSNMLVSLAAVYALGRTDLDTKVAQDRLETWFWCGVFGSAYRFAVNSRIASDVMGIPDFVKHNRELDTVSIAQFDPLALMSLRNRRSGAYKGVHALQLRHGCRDWRSNRKMDHAAFESERIDIHHIFPKAWCANRERNGMNTEIPARVYDSAVNKATLLAKTNQVIGSQAPSKYIVSLQRDNDEVESAIKSALASPESMREDDFLGFYIDRGVKLTELIYDAMRKPPPSDREASLVAALSQERLGELDDGVDDSIPDEEDTPVPIDD